MTSPSGSTSGSASPSATLGADASTRMATALAAEHAAIYGYGVLGPHLPSAQASLAHAAEEAHRVRRDHVTELLGTAAPSTAVAYELPFAVTDAASAQRLAAVLEEGVTSAWRAVLVATEGGSPYRKLVLDAMTDAAVRTTAWKKAAGTAPTTVPFPGRP